jgi:hypothetical protein
MDRPIEEVIIADCGAVGAGSKNGGVEKNAEL